MEALEPVLVIDLLPDERAALLRLLGQLSEEEWARATVCPGWSVKDIALHLLGDDVGRLSSSRDGFQHDSPKGDSWRDLVDWLDQWNQAWVEVTRRISPRLLCELLALTGEQTCQYFSSLDLYALGGPVSWAGPEPAPVWLDIAREYTERWAHHQQIRDALGRPGLKERRYFAPVLDTFVRALPLTFQDTQADEGATVGLVISGDAGGQWVLVRERGAWNLYRGVTSGADSVVTIDEDTAWRLFTRGISRDEARRRAAIEGDLSLALKVLDTVSIIV